MRADMSLLALSGTPSDVAGVRAGRRRLPADARARRCRWPSRICTAAPSPRAPPPPPPPPRTPAEPGRRDVWLDLPPGRGRAAVGARRAPAPSTTAKGPATPKPDGRLLRRVLRQRAAAPPRSDAYRYLIAAQDGRVLERHNLTADAAFRYRVFADASGDFRPLDGPIADFTPHPAGLPDGSYPRLRGPRAGLDRELQDQAAHGHRPLAARRRRADPGQQRRRLRRPVRARRLLERRPARHHHRARHLRPQSTTPSLDPGASASQTMAATTKLFFVINWLHDYWYDSGFDEAAGNAQNDNFGRGGAGGDAIRAEAQDSGGRNNANMSTPGGRRSPRACRCTCGAHRRPTARSPSSPAPLGARPPASPPSAPRRSTSRGDVVLAADGTAPPTDACQPLTNDVAGRIVLLDPRHLRLRRQGAGRPGGGRHRRHPGQQRGRRPPPGLGQPIPPVAVGHPHPQRQPGRRRPPQAAAGGRGRPARAPATATVVTAPAATARWTT